MNTADRNLQLQEMNIIKQAIFLISEYWLPAFEHFFCRAAHRHWTHLLGGSANGKHLRIPQFTCHIKPVYCLLSPIPIMPGNPKGNEQYGKCAEWNESIWCSRNLHQWSVHLLWNSAKDITDLSWKNLWILTVVLNTAVVLQPARPKVQVSC